MSFLSRWRRVPVALAASALLLTLIPAPPAAAGPAPGPAGTVTAAQPTGESPPAARAPVAAPGEYEVVLITGDRVRATVLPDGQVQATPEPGRQVDGAPVTFSVDQPAAGGVYVVPSDAAELVAAGRLDRGLFNVAQLVAAEQADAEADTLPVIVQYEDVAGAEALAQAASALPGAGDVRPVTSIDAAAVQVARSALPRLWERLRATDSGRAGPPAPARPGIASAPEPATVWLDQTLRLQLDRSVPQVGAPAAWDAGFDGTGVRVAVLDSGIDDSHPDLAGRVVAAASFRGNDPSDNFGHGTHVAAILAGGSEGSPYRGVAPGADLLNGKVCDFRGSCPTSSVLAGMEWAAIEQDADVVNLSLGTGFPDDGSDPMSQLVEQLTTSHGTLFVASAGNAGPGTSTVSAPGSAPSALTVGAADRSGRVAWFSSRGPLAGSQAQKPELLAPGVGIVAARAAGIWTLGPPVGERHVAVSGTSMASPHVAGAAAILAQQHPDWRPAELKAALVSTARPEPVQAMNATGAGLLDVAAAVALPLLPSAGMVDFGPVEVGGGATESRTVTLTNPGAADLAVTLDASLASEAGQPADDRIAVTPGELTVPSGGTATVTVQFDPDGPALGFARGVVRVRGVGGDPLLRLPVAVVNEALHTVTLRITPPAGQRLVPRSITTLQLERLDVPRGLALIFLGDDPYRGRLRIPAGTYHIQLNGTVSTLAPDGVLERMMLFNPEFVVEGDRELVLAGDDTRPVTVDGGPRSTVPRMTGVGFARHLPGDRPQEVAVARATRGAVHATGERFRVSVAPPVTLGSLGIAAGVELTEPLVSLAVDGPDGFPLAADYPHYHHARPRVELDTTLELVDVGLGLPGDLAGVDLTGRAALVTMPGLARSNGSVPGSSAFVNHQDRVETWQRLQDAGAVAAVTYGTFRRPGWTFPGHPEGAPEVALPVFVVGSDDGPALRARAAARGSVPLAVTSRAEPESYAYSLRLEEEWQTAPYAYQLPPEQALVTVDARYHGSLPADIVRRVQTWQADGPVTTQPGTLVAAGTARTEYLGPADPEVLWTQAATGSVPGGTHRLEQVRLTAYPEPGVTTQRWFAGPPVPGGIRPDPAVAELVAANEYPGVGKWAGGINRQLDHVEAGLRRQFGSPATTGNVTGGPTVHELWRDGEPIPPSSGGGWVVPPDPEPAVYRLTERFTPSEHQLLPRPAAVETDWWFRSQTTREDDTPIGLVDPCGRSGNRPFLCRVEPVLHLAYGLADLLALDNTLPGGGTVRVPVTAFRQYGAPEDPPVTEFEAWASFDGGDSWQPLAAEPRGGGEYNVVVVHPAGLAGEVGLRVHAADDAGNRVEQTILGALLKRCSGAEVELELVRGRA